MKNAEWFSGIFAAASVAIPADTKNREYNVLYKSVMDCIRGGENDSGYIRNQLGYNSENLPTSIVNAKETTAEKRVMLTKSELFAIVYNKAMNDVRAKVADATANEVWGFSFAGMRGINGYITPYCGAIEREASDVVFVASKDDAKSLISQGIKPAKVSKTGQKQFSMSITDYVKNVLDKKLPGQGIADKHEKFVSIYRTKLGKYLDFRTQRLSVGVTDITDGYEW